MKAPKLFAVLALLVVPATLTPATVASSPCDQAVAVFQQALAKALYELTPPVALSLADAARACAVSPDDVIPDVLPVDEGELLRTAHRVLARDCGFLGPMTKRAPHTMINVTYQVNTPAWVTNQKESDLGDALATYDPAIDLVTYTNHGKKWGIEAVNAQPGSPKHATVYLYGIPIPATTFTKVGSSSVGTGTGDASAGCSQGTSGELCWANSEAHVMLTVVLGIHIHSRFNLC